MFTGIVEEKAEVFKIYRRENISTLTIKAKKVLSGLKKGDSVAVNGVCLTITNKTKNHLSFDVMKETLDKSSLGALIVGEKVNLERALKASDRLSGHIVTGHIDSTVKVLEIIKQKNYVEFVFSLDKNLKRFIVNKGSVCLDGVSLTIGVVKKHSFSVYLIPFTMQVTTFGFRKVSDVVNVEVDIVAKYLLG